MYNQSLIKDLRFETIAKAKTRSARGKIAFIEEMDALYTGKVDDTLVADDDLVIESAETDVYWVKQVTGGGSTLPVTGPSDSTPSAINGSITFADVKGKDAAEVLMTLHFPATVPAQNAPVLSRVTPATLTIDKGDALTTVELLFTQNQGGAVNGNYVLTVNGGTPLSAADPTFDVSGSSACQSVIAPVAFSATVPYDAGDIPNDSYGEPAPSKQIQAGDAALSFTVTPIVHTFHGLQAKGENVAGKTAAELRTLADTFTQATGVMGSFANVTIPNTSDYYILVPGTMSTVVTISQGFTITGIGTIEGQVQVNDKFGTESSIYTVVKLAGQASTSVIDTVTLG